MFETELNVAKELALEAGRIILGHYDQDVEVGLKKEMEPVTQADKDSNHFITTQIAKRFPQDGIMAEESKDSTDRLHKERVWVIDPMDGTKEFIDKIGQFAVMIGLVENGSPVLGVVHQPTTGMLLHAVKGQGAFLSQDGTTKRVEVSAVANVADMRLVVSRSHRSHLVDSIKNKLGIDREIASGSVGLKVGLLIQQESDVYMHPNSKTKEWDTAAPQIILEEAGGRMTDCWGREMKYNKENVYNSEGFVASNGSSHSEIISKIEPFLADMD